MNFMIIKHKCICGHLLEVTLDEEFTPTECPACHEPIKPPAQLTQSSNSLSGSSKQPTMQVTSGPVKKDEREGVATKFGEAMPVLLIGLGLFGGILVLTTWFLTTAFQAMQPADPLVVARKKFWNEPTRAAQMESLRDRFVRLGFRLVEGETLNVDQPVNNKTLFYCDELKLTGQVTSDLVILARLATLENKLGGNVFFGGEKLIVTHASTVEGYVHSENAETIAVQGKINGGLRGRCGTLKGDGLIRYRPIPFPWREYEDLSKPDDFPTSGDF